MTLLRSNDKKTVNNEWNTRSRPAVGEETIYKILKREQMEIFKQYKSKVDHLRRYAQAISKLINKGEKWINVTIAEQKWLTTAWYAVLPYVVQNVVRK